MKTHTIKQISLVALFVLGMTGLQQVLAQTNYSSNTTQTTVKGTSTLHDWEMKSTNGQSKATFTVADGKVTDLTALTFTVVAESLKSDKNGLDKNAYKALDTDKHKNITFTLTNATVTQTGANTFKISATGNLQIAGSSKRTTITADGQYNATDKSITVRGNTTFNMSAYGVKPPVLMMGTIKTGDEITISYQVKLAAN